MASRLLRWRTLPRRERRDSFILLLLQSMVSAGLRTIGYRRTLALLTATSHGSLTDPHRPDALKGAHRLAELAKAVGQHGVIETTCLRQSLAVYWLLRRRGLQPQVKLGVGRLGDAPPDMHAWVELDGEALAQPGLRHAAFAEAAIRQSDTTATTSGKRA